MSGPTVGVQWQAVHVDKDIHSIYPEGGLLKL